MKTISIMIQSLCVPCFNHCRHCLLQWDGKVHGVSWKRAEAFTERFQREVNDLRSALYFGCSMDHPDMREALRFLRRTGSPAASFLQCDGMRMRNEAECAQWVNMVKEEGVTDLNFTVYGQEAYHDAFAERSEDHAYLLRLMKTGIKAGLHCSAGILLTKENVTMIDAVIKELREIGCSDMRLFLPHEEGRGKYLQDVRIEKADLQKLSPFAQSLLNQEIYRTEAEWVKDPGPEETVRTLLVSLTPETIDHYEAITGYQLICELEELDDAYYASYPSFASLCAQYGDTKGMCLYSRRDLFYHYRRMYAAEHDIRVYDVTDERHSGSRRL